jgi:hypothetical protein
VTRQGIFARLVRTRLVPLIAPLLFRSAAMRRFFFRTISQIGVNYRNSPLSAGAAGAVRGGDRLPWVELGGGTDNFTTLESLQWQVHCYGEPSPAIREACAATGLALHSFPWQTAMKRAGLRKNAVYLVRPDGYVGLADRAGDGSVLRRYLEKHDVRPAEKGEATFAFAPGRPVAARPREGASVGAQR